MADDVPRLRPFHLVLAEPAVGDQLIKREIILPTHNRLILEPYDHLAVVEACGLHARAKTREHRVGIEDVDRIVFGEIRNDRPEVATGEVLVFLLALEVVIGDCLIFVCTQFQEAFLVFDIRNSIGRVSDDRANLVLADNLPDIRPVERVAAGDDMVANLKNISFIYFHIFSSP